MNIYCNLKCNVFRVSIVLLLLCSCVGKHNKSVSETEVAKPGNKANNSTDTPSKGVSTLSPFYSGLKRQRIKLGHTINTAANEYLPICNATGNKLYFSAMDRTGFFDFKLDFTKEKSAGGEDIYLSELREGIWDDARPLRNLNTNGHEVVTQVFRNGDFMIAGNYPEKLGVKKDKDAGFQTTDLFYVRNTNGASQVIHLPEPVNSIFTEADGFMTEDQSCILFVSDRSGNVGEYHKKGWKWNESFWGNSDVYVSLKDGDDWSVPINLGNKVNTPFAERTPWLSADGLTLFLSSNGYINGKTDLDVYAFKRKSVKDWTSWEGPFVVQDANSAYDDWGYKENQNGDAFVASAHKLGFVPTQKGMGGDGGIRETNFRPGYELHGQQIAVLNKEFETNIYQLQASNNPVFTASDLFFDFNSAVIKKEFKKYLLLFIDQIIQNKEVIILVNGYTDDFGTDNFNLVLSQNRADAVKSFLVENGVRNPIVSKGFGKNNPIVDNLTSENRSKNRRVEILIK